MTELAMNSDAARECGEVSRLSTVGVRIFPDIHIFFGSDFANSP